MTEPYTIKGPELAGFDLACYIREDCTIQLLGDKPWMEIPKEVRMLNNTYTFEYLTIGMKTIYAVDVNPEHVKRAMRLVGHEGMVFCNLGYV